ncbi:Gfo/Idh/MocA family oxidoreductase [Microlunatus panaciterrae]|uniref:Dehydrogenase n=1 Tax=Microlunatus panaciterrae TaxID=400768 RepID=A0ABS2RLY0_9ACTN|nr:Gfo/Idh/MocA family oxidoreductase [Microlunatus panaciterrae]MBM7800019.1 putative dehydrogenase [Microlunatus panaciterrae]
MIDIAVVGLGFGADFVPLYQAHPDVGRVGIVDPDPGRLAAVAKRCQVADSYRSLEDLLDSRGWDAVHLLTPVALHADQVIKVLESGRHCACAVPMATSLADIDRIIAVQGRTGRTYMMMETAVCSREFFYARSLLERGQLGQLSFFRGEHLQNLDGYPPYWLGFPPMHYVTHALSPALALADARAESVRCLGSGLLTPQRRGLSGNTFGTETALFTLRRRSPASPGAAEEALAANITVSFFQLGRSYLEGFSVYGDAGALEWPQLEGGPMKQFRMSGRTSGQRGRPVDVIDLHPPAVTGTLPAPLQPFTVSGGHGGSHPHLVHEFVRSLVEGRPPVVDHRAAARFTAPGICAHSSAMSAGAEVAIPDYG